MVIPQFSLRRLLAVMAGCGVFFLIVSMAVRGSKVPLGLAIGLSSVLLSLAIYGVMFFMVWLVSLLPFGRGRAAVETGPSPFKPGGAMIAPTVLVKAQAEGAAGLGESPFAPVWDSPPASDSQPP
jgi:hypothetical protein